MDWGKAKTILILSFLLLNGLLGYQLWFHNMNILGSGTEETESANEIEELLRDRGIRLEKEIPKETPKVPDIILYNTEGEPPVLVLDPPISTNSLINRNDLQSTLAMRIPNSEEYRLDEVLSGNGLYIFHQLYKDLPMFEINLELHAEAGLVETYKQHYVDVFYGNNREDLRVLPAYKAVEFLAENYLRRGSTIVEVQLGYHGQSYNSDTQYLAPKWRIAMLDGTIYYIHALNGEVEIAEKES